MTQKNDECCKVCRCVQWCVSSGFRKRCKYNQTGDQYTMPRQVGDTMSFSGGAEVTPTVTVQRFVMPGSLHHADVNFRIHQGDRYIYLSPETMKAILEWYGGETDCCEGCKEPFTAKDIDGGRCISCGRSIT